MDYNRTRFPRTPGRDNRYGSGNRQNSKESGKSKFFSILAGQTIICAAILVFALVFRFANNNGYREFKKSINASFLGSKNLAEFTVRLEEFTEKSEVFAGIFGPKGAIPIFRFEKGSSSSGQTDTSGTSRGSGNNSSDNSHNQSSGSADSASGNTSQNKNSSSLESAAAPVGGDAFFYDEMILESLYLTGEKTDFSDKIHPSIISLPLPVSQPLKEGWVSSEFGKRKNPFTGKDEFHPAIDVAVPVGTSVYAAMDAKVIEAKSGEKSGKYILLSHGDGIETVYAHLSSFKVKQGENVKSGDIIALSGNTGASTGAHLHFEIRYNNKYMNPALYFKCFC